MPEKSSLLHAVSVVGSISRASSLPRLHEIATPDACDIVELRLDCYPEPAEIDTLASVISKVPVPILITARHPGEGGQNSLPSHRRIALIRQFLPHATLVDLELRSLGEFTALVKEIKNTKALLVASFHDFERTPGLNRLKEIVSQSKAHGADIAKVATTLQTAGDLANLTHLFSPAPLQPLSVMGMGELGKISRLLFARLGSILNYGYLDTPTVPGQWEAKRLRELIKEISA